MSNESAIDSPELLLTSDQVVQRLLSHPVLRRRASTCVLTAVKVGEEWHFRSSDLDAWIAGQLFDSICAAPRN